MPQKNRGSSPASQPANEPATHGGGTGPSLPDSNSDVNGPAESSSDTQQNAAVSLNDALHSEPNTNADQPPAQNKSKLPQVATRSARPLLPQRTAPTNRAPEPQVTRKARKPEPREWFARLRIREDRLARLWVANLASRDVVVWSHKEKRWVALLGVPELRDALKAAEQERANNPRSVAGRPSSVPPTRLSQPPASLPPSPPPTWLRTTTVSTAGELRLQSIAQDAMAASLGRTKAVSRATIPPSTPSSSRQRLASYSRSYGLGQSPLRESSLKIRASRWHWLAIERMLWVLGGALFVLALSAANANDEHSTPFEPASVVLAADVNALPEIDNAGATARNDPTVAKSPWFGDLQIQTPLVPSGCPSLQSVAESRERLPQDPMRRDDVRQGDGERTTVETDSGHSTTTKAHPHVPAFLREAVQASAQQPEIQEDFDFAAARIALINAAINARSCPGSNLRGKAIVTFDPSGQARAVDIPLLIGDGVDRDCIARTFKGVHVPKFTGGAVAVKKDF